MYNCIKLIMAITFFAPSLSGCATCVGRVTHDSPLFFLQSIESQEKSSTNKTDQLVYKEIKKEEKK